MLLYFTIKLLTYGTHFSITLKLQMFLVLNIVYVIMQTTLKLIFYL